MLDEAYFPRFLQHRREVLVLFKNDLVNLKRSPSTHDSEIAAFDVDKVAEDHQHM